MTSWVPLAESGIDHALYVEPPFESSITLDGSTIVADNATRVPNFGIGWDLDISVADVPEYFTGRVRVATQIDYVDAPEAGPLVFYYSEEGGANPAIVNEHEDSTAFVPDPVVLGPLAPWSGPGSDGLVQFTAWGIDVLSATFYIEVEVQDDGPPSGECFWTDLLGVTEDCGGESPDPEPPEVIDATGVLDPEFAVVASFNGPVDLIKQLSNGNIVVLGRFSFGMSTSSRGHLLLDPYADVALGGAINMGPNSPSAAAILDAGDVYYIAGQWGGFDQNYLRARDPATGASVTSGFSLPTLQNIPRSAVFWPSDGRIAIAGSFTHINSVSMSRLGVINPDGSLYDGFSDPGIGGSLDFRIVLAALTDGSLIVTTPGGVRRYLPDGTQDASFSLGYDGISTSMAETPDGGFVAFAYNSDTWPTIFVAKMDATGAPWPGFTPLAIATGTASLGQLCVYPDGRILAAAGSVYRILPNGSLDPEWEVPTLGGARGVSLQADGKVLVCGEFTSVNGQARSYIARLM